MTAASVFRCICLTFVVLGFTVCVPSDFPAPHHCDAAYSAAGASQLPVVAIRGEVPVKGSAPSAGILPAAVRSAEVIPAYVFAIPGYQPSFRRVHAFPRFSRGTFF